MTGSISVTCLPSAPVYPRRHPDLQPVARQENRAPAGDLLRAWALGASARTARGVGSSMRGDACRRGERCSPARPSRRPPRRSGQTISLSVSEPRRVNPDSLPSSVLDLFEPIGYRLRSGVWRFGNSLTSTGTMQCRLVPTNTRRCCLAKDKLMAA